MPLCTSLPATFDASAFDGKRARRTRDFFFAEMNRVHKERVHMKAQNQRALNPSSMTLQSPPENVEPEPPPAMSASLIMTGTPREVLSSPSQTSFRDSSLSSTPAAALKNSTFFGLTPTLKHTVLLQGWTRMKPSTAPHEALQGTRHLPPLHPGRGGATLVAPPGSRGKMTPTLGNTFPPSTGPRRSGTAPLSGIGSDLPRFLF